MFMTLNRMNGARKEGRGRKREERVLKKLLRMGGEKKVQMCSDTHTHNAGRP